MVWVRQLRMARTDATGPFSSIHTAISFALPMSSSAARYCVSSDASLAVIVAITAGSSTFAFTPSARGRGRGER